MKMFFLSSLQPSCGTMCSICWPFIQCRLFWSAPIFPIQGHKTALLSQKPRVHFSYWHERLKCSPKSTNECQRGDKGLRYWFILGFFLWISLFSLGLVCTFWLFVIEANFLLAGSIIFMTLLRIRDSCLNEVTSANRIHGMMGQSWESRCLPGVVGTSFLYVFFTLLHHMGAYFCNTLTLMPPILCINLLKMLSRFTNTVKYL